MKLYHTPEAAEIAGITERQIAHWIKIGVAHPTRSASGSGSQIGWSREDVAKLATIGRLARLSVSGKGGGLPRGMWTILDEPGDVLVIAGHQPIAADRGEVPDLVREFPALIVINRVRPVL